MAVRSAVELLPIDVRKELEKRLVSGAFSGYSELSEWLDTEGFSISRSTVHRFGQRFQARIEAIQRSTQMARALREQIGDDAGDMTDATLRLAQHLVFELVQKINPDELDTIDPTKLIRAMADLSRASVTQKRWQAEFEERVKERTAEAAEAVEREAKQSGVSAEGIAFMRRKILGIPEKEASSA